MNQAVKKERIYYYEQHKVVDTFAQDIHSGLSAPVKRLSPKYFYDQHGSELFDQICQLPEYYPTRTETQLLEQHADEFRDLMGEESVLFELGSGSSQKIRILLAALKPSFYVPMDISKEHLIASANQLAKDFPWLEVHANRVDYSKPWQVPDFGSRRYNAFFPGSSIGNFDPQAAVKLLQQIAQLVGSNGGLLIGVDVKKDRQRLEAAYNDSAGVTAQFNLNILQHIKARLNSDLEIENFAHQAIYNEALGRIEMHLVSLCSQSFQIEDKNYRMQKGETIHTESSYKYAPDEFHQLAKLAGFYPQQVWQDDEQLFSLHYLTVGQGAD